MRNSMRDSGIDDIGNIRWGTHIASLFNSKEEIIEVTIPYIYSGLKNNELCLWVSAENVDMEDIKSNLGKYLENVDSYIESGQLVIVPYKDWYLQEGCFNEVRVNKQWRQYVKRALDQGYEGLRAVADTSWMEKSFFRSFQNYEKNVNNMIAELPFVVICLYDAKKVNAYEVAGIVKNHSYVITKYEGSLEIIKNVELLIKDKQLKESEERYKKLLELLPVSIFIHDKKRIFYCNLPNLETNKVKNKCGSDGKSILNYVPTRNRADFSKFIEGILSGNKDIDYYESEFIHSCGQIKTVEIISTQYNYYGHPTVLSVVRDVTPFKRINELELDIKKKKELLDYTLELDKMKTEFFSNISHELRTPINIILGIIQLMELQIGQDINSGDKEDYIKIMKQNSLRLVRLVNNIIDLTKIDSDYYQINKQNCDIVNLVEDITMSVVYYAKNKDINITFDTNVEEKIIACDPDQMERIILNLLSNAVKFTQRYGKILVSVNDYGEHMTITIKDNGIGIPGDKLKNIFNRFEQVDKSLRRHYEGSGIGLSIVKALVDKHDGTITVNSEQGKGSEFIIDIPCDLVQEEYSLENETNLHIKGCADYIERISLEFSDVYIN